MVQKQYYSDMSKKFKEAHSEYRTSLLEYKEHIHKNDAWSNKEWIEKEKQLSADMNKKFEIMKRIGEEEVEKSKKNTAT